MSPRLETRMSAARRRTVAALLVLVVAASVTTAAGARRTASDEHNLVPEAATCAAAGATFDPNPWRVPSDVFAGYSCLIPVSSGVPDPSLVPQSARDAAAARCARVLHGSFLDISTFAYVGYGCSWLR